MLPLHVTVCLPSAPMESYAAENAVLFKSQVTQPCIIQALMALPGECRLHPGRIQLKWAQFAEAQVNLFVSPESAHC